MKSISKLIDILFQVISLLFYQAVKLTNLANSRATALINYLTVACL